MVCNPFKIFAGRKASDCKVKGFFPELGKTIKNTCILFNFIVAAYAAINDMDFFRRNMIGVHNGLFSVLTYGKNHSGPFCNGSAHSAAVKMNEPVTAGCEVCGIEFLI